MQGNQNVLREGAACKHGESAAATAAQEEESALLAEEAQAAVAEAEQEAQEENNVGGNAELDSDLRAEVGASCHFCKLEAGL